MSKCPLPTQRIYAPRVIDAYKAIIWVASTTSRPLQSEQERLFNGWYVAIETQEKWMLNFMEVERSPK